MLQEKPYHSIQHFRRHLGIFLESFHVQLAILVLIGLDILLLIIEIILDSLTECPEIEGEVHTWEHAFRWSSVGILSLFLLEQLLLLFAFGHKYFRYLN